MEVKITMGTNESTTVIITSQETNDSEKSLHKEDLKKIALQFASDMLLYSNKLRAKGINDIAEHLLVQAEMAACSSEFANGAFTRELFEQHLKDGFYASVRCAEYLKIVATCGFSCEGHSDLAETADKMLRMYAASVKTASRKKAKQD